MKLPYIFIAMCAKALAQDYIDGQYFIHVDESLVQSTSQEEAFVNVLTSFNVELKKFYHFNQKKVLYVHGDANDIERVGQMKEVKLVEQNAMAYADQDCTDNHSPGTWGLDRSDQREPLLYSDPFSLTATYSWSDNGMSVKTYVFDTGIDFNHSNFEGRAEWGYVASEITNQTPGDFNGHGTHVAGIIASRNYGMARQGLVAAIKILNDDGSGPWSAVIEGMDWLTNLPDRYSHVCGCMSVSGVGQISAVEASMEVLIRDSNVPMAVSAGNSNTDACSHTPAFIPDCMTIGAIDISDTRASFSNYGDCVDVYAPGVDILSTTPNESAGVYSGTSSAAAHVAGYANRMLGRNYDPFSPQLISYRLKLYATSNAIADIPSGHNLLMYADCHYSINV